MAHCTYEQENFWSGAFGSQYIQRNRDTNEAVANRIGFWAAILAATSPHLPERALAEDAIGHLVCAFPDRVDARTQDFSAAFYDLFFLLGPHSRTAAP